VAKVRHTGRKQVRELRYEAALPSCPFHDRQGGRARKRPG
jgi:hypothetical protein